MHSMIELLEAAIETEEMIEIVYMGGSQPGTSRTIIPKQIKGDCLKAICTKSHTKKDFKIALITLPGSNSFSEYDSKLVFKTYESIQDLCVSEISLFEQANLHHESTESSIFLYKKYKNGKVHKHPHIFIEYQKYTTSRSIDEDGNVVEETIERVKNWVTPKSSYLHFQKAAESFVRAVREHTTSYMQDISTASSIISYERPKSMSEILKQLRSIIGWRMKTFKLRKHY